MTIGIFALKEKLIEKILLVRLFFVGYTQCQRQMYKMYKPPRKEVIPGI